MTSAGPLLGIGRFAEVDASVSALADRYRAQGPPTLLHWALQTLAYSASFQGRQRAGRAVLRRSGHASTSRRVRSRPTSSSRPGRRSAAAPGASVRTARSYIDEQVETDNVAVASVVCVEFINMMAAIDRLAEAAHMLSYLAAANEFGALAAQTLVAEAAREDRRRRCANRRDRRAASPHRRPPGPRLHA